MIPPAAGDVTVDPGREADLRAPVERTDRAGRVWKVFAVVVTVALFAGLLAYGFTQNGDLPSALIGRTAPDFALADMDTGQLLSLRDLRGKVVVLNYWASWCVSCRKEHPNFVAAWDRYRDRGVVFVGVLFQDTAGNAQKYMKELGGDWPTLLDPGSRTAMDYGVYGVPETFFIGRDGVVATKQIGPTSYPALIDRIEALLSAPGKGSSGAR